jgi:uncharacterized OsmC-like protein
MSCKISCTYEGDGQTALVHGPTGAQIKTDLPPDNGGKGRMFSPTDLFAASLGACILTIMGEAAKKHGHDLKGAGIEIEKEMSASPRRVGKIALKITLPAHLQEADKKRYLECVKACPVHRSLHPDIKVDIC